MTPFIGPTYNLLSRPASVQRTVNLIPVPLEPGNERTQFVFKDVPGRALFASMGAEVRGGININGRVFVAAGSTLYEVYSDGTKTSRGTLATSTGLVEFTANTVQLVFSDQTSLYVYTLASNTLATASGYPGGARIAYVDQYILYLIGGTQEFGWSVLGDASNLDPLNFASAEGSPDNLVSMVVDHREVWLLGINSVEVWADTGTSAVFQRNPSAFLEIGCAAAQSAQKLDNSVFWLGQDERGGGIVWRAQGYTPQRISTRAIEEHLTGLDLSAARAFTYQQNGSSFYVLTVPGLSTSLVYDCMSQMWHERTDLVDGNYSLPAINCHVYAFNKTLVGGSDGNLYQLDQAVSSNNGASLVRDRIAPVLSTPDHKLLKFPDVEFIGDKGQGGKALLRWSDDNGANWSSWHEASLGALGRFQQRTRWHMLGSSRDRVFHLRCTDNVSFNPVDLHIRAG